MPDAVRLGGTGCSTMAEALPPFIPFIALSSTGMGWTSSSGVISALMVASSGPCDGLRAVAFVVVRLKLRRA